MKVGYTKTVAVLIAIGMGVLPLLLRIAVGAMAVHVLTKGLGITTDIVGSILAYVGADALAYLLLKPLMRENV